MEIQNYFVWSEWTGQCAGLYFDTYTEEEARVAYCDAKGIHRMNAPRMKVCPASDTIPF